VGLATPRRRSDGSLCAALTVANATHQETHVWDDGAVATRAVLADGSALPADGGSSGAGSGAAVLLFDDSFAHWVHHACARGEGVGGEGAGGDRVVFQLVIAHPDLVDGRAGGPAGTDAGEGPKLGSCAGH
jgi:hypothetical protein